MSDVGPMMLQHVLSYCLVEIFLRESSISKRPAFIVRPAVTQVAEKLMCGHILEATSLLIDDY